MAQSETLGELSETLAKFAHDRDWDQFHTPKNLSMALAVEVAEIMEIFQWKTAEESVNLSSEEFGHLRDELADSFVYLIRLADISGVDLMEAARKKIEKNQAKYPADLVRGSAAKYTEYQK